MFQCALALYCPLCPDGELLTRSLGGRLLREGCVMLWLPGVRYCPIMAMQSLVSVTDISLEPTACLGEI